MKKILLILLITVLHNAYSQDSLLVKKIDSLVTAINHSPKPLQKDTIVTDKPEYGIWITSYVSALADSIGLHKFVNHVIAVRKENEVRTETTTENIFYYSENRLIKVEEYAVAKGEKIQMDWYFWEEKPVYFTFKSPRSEERARQLISLATAIQKPYLK